jgi:alpha/beta superfamily hydrolase
MKNGTIEIPLTFKCEKQQIVGILHLPKEKRKIPLVILVHGWSANKLGTWNAFFVKAARGFSKNGFAVLRFDFRGSGDSEGRFKTKPLHLC